MMICGYGILNLALRVYLSLIFLSNADADEPLLVPFSTPADQHSDSTASMSVERSDVVRILNSEVTGLTALKGQFSSRVEAESRFEQSFGESLSFSKRTLKAMVFSWDVRREASRRAVAVTPAFSVTEDDKSLSLATTHSESLSPAPHRPSDCTKNYTNDIGKARKMITTSLPAEPKQIASHNHSGSGNASSGTVPSLPVEGSEVPCDLDFSGVNFGGVAKACSVEENDVLRRRRCCPVLAAWLYSSTVRTAFQPPLPQPFEMPVPPDDSQVCSASLEAALQDQNIRLSPPNSSCDLIACFCGIRLHQIESVSCPVKLHHGTSLNFTATPTFRAMEMNCTDPSYSGCKNCLATLEAPVSSSLQIEAITSKSNAADCRMMGLLWLLATNRTLYLPTVSAVLRATVYQANSMQCSLDKEHMPLAYDYAGPAYPSSARSKYEWSLLGLTSLLLVQFLHIR